MFEIVHEPIDPQRLIDYVRTDADGAVDVFLGVARRWSPGREVIHLEYEAYPAMATKKMAEIADEARVKWGIERMAIVHRVGELEIGEASVCIAVAAPHRQEAFAACQYAIDRLKQTVPIWKKEVWSDGSQWIGWEGAAGASLEAPRPEPLDVPPVAVSSNEPSPRIGVFETSPESEPLPTEGFRVTEMAWLETHRAELSGEYPGEWVAIEGTQLVAHARTLTELLGLASGRGHPHPFVTALPAGPIREFYG